MAPEGPPSPHPGPEAAAHPAPPPSWCGAGHLACFLNNPAPPGPPPPRAAWWVPGGSRGGGHVSWAPACSWLSPGPPASQPQVPVPPSLPLLGVAVPDLRTLPLLGPPGAAGISKNQIPERLVCPA